MELLAANLKWKCSASACTSCCLLCLIVLVFTKPCLYAATFKPDQVKAAFIYNLTNFVTWPDSQSLGPERPIVIAVVGSQAIAHNLLLLTKGETLKGRPFYIKFIQSLSEIGDCQILFLDKSMEAPLGEMLRDLARQGVLTIGDSPDFLKNGGMVGLLPKGKRIQIVINVDAARNAGISFNSKLLKVAKIIRSIRGMGK